MFRRRQQRRFEPTIDERRERQIEKVHSLTYALLLDLAAWFLDVHEPVDGRLFPEYRLQGVRDLADPRERLGRYLSPELLATWEPVRERWVSAGLRLKPDYGTTATLEIEGLEGDQTPRAITRFTDRSVIERGTERQYNNRAWVLTAWLRSDLSMIENATFRPASPPGA
jgi:hypothetical protein